MAEEHLSVSGVAVKASEVAPPQPDPAHAAEFLTWWFGAPNAGVFEVGWKYPDAKGVDYATHYDLAEWQLAQIADSLVEMNAKGVDVYFRPALLKPHEGSATDSDFLAASGIWADLDTPDAIKTAAKVESIVRPSGVVITGTVPSERMHLYYKAVEAITDGEVVRNLNKRIASLYGRKADPAVVNPSSYMRLPGFVSWPKKNKPGRIPELVTFTPMDPARVYPVARFQDALPQIEQADPNLTYSPGQREYEGVGM